MQLIKARNISDIKDSVELYCDQETDEIIETNKTVSFNNLITESKRSFYRVLIDDSGKLVGWVLAYKVQNQFNGYMELQQQFYTSIYAGIKAYKAVMLVHEELIKYAELYKIPVVTSHCSHNDSNFTLCRMLSKSGWLTRGYMAYWRTSWHPKPTLSSCAQPSPRHTP